MIAYDVVIPTSGKRVDALFRSVLSALHQSEPPKTIVVSWDGEKIPFEIKSRLTELGCIVVESPRPFLGVAAARNRGIESSSSEFVALLDDDDYWLEDKIKNQFSLLGSYKSTHTVVIASRTMFEHAGFLEKKIAPKLSRRSMTYNAFCFHNMSFFSHRNMISTSGIIFSRILFQKITFDETLEISEDIDFLARCSGYAEFLIPKKPGVVTTIRRSESGGLSNKRISTEKWLDWIDSLGTVLSSRQIANIRLRIGTRIVRNNLGFIAACRYFAKSIRGSADFVTRVNTFLRLFC